MKIAILTSGGLAPCLSPSVTFLVEQWRQHRPNAEIYGYRNGYAGLLAGDLIPLHGVDPQALERGLLLGGSLLGNSRVKLSNAKDCVKKGLIEEEQDPFEVAAKQLLNDSIDVLHVVGGDDTALTAGELVKFFQKERHNITVVGLPKTIDNDITPIYLSLGAQSAAQHGSTFAQHFLAEHTATPNSIIIHEIMGRNSGWLTLATAEKYRRWVNQTVDLPGLVMPTTWDVHKVIIPELGFEPNFVVQEMGSVFDRLGCLNIFIAEGAGAQTVIDEKIRNGEDVERDAYGHPRLDGVNVGAWLGSHLKKELGAAKLQVGKSGYFARSGPANDYDLHLIEQSAIKAVQYALLEQSGVVGMDQDLDNKLCLITFDRVKGGKAVDITSAWAQSLLESSQP